MLTTMSQSSSSANGGSVMPSWHFGNGAVGMTIPGTNGNSICGVNNTSNSNNNSNNVSATMSVGNNGARLIGMPSTSGGSVASSSSSASSSLGGAPGDLLNLNRQVKLEYSPTGMYGGSSSTPDLEPEIRARANTWHAERKRPDRQMLESLLEEDDDSPEDSLSGVKPESLSPLGDSNLMGGSPLSTSAGGHGPNSNKKISRRNAWGNLSYADLITKAIECSPEKRLTLSQIYDWMVQNIPYFKDKGDTTSSAGWKNSIRHNLSLHTRFMRVQNESSGKSSWWVINPDASKSGKSPRRRAASIDTKNFERKRGRVKKRLQALQGSSSTDFGSALGSRNLSTSSINSASASASGTGDGNSSTSHHDYRPLHFGSSTASLESRLQHLASNDPCWSEAPNSGASGVGSVGFDMDLDSPSKNQSATDSYHQQLFGGAPQAGARSNNTNSTANAAAYGNLQQQQQQGQAAGAASTPPHLTTTYLQLQGSYHLAAVANTPNSHHHHHGSPGSAAPAAMGTFHTFHSSPFGQHPTAAAPASSYNMPPYHLQSMSSYNGGNGSGGMTLGGDNMFQANGGPGTSPQLKSYSSLQPVALNSFKPQQQQQPNYGAPPSNNGNNGNANNNGLIGTVHHHHHTSNNNNNNANHHQQPPQLNQQQQLLGLGAGNNSAVMTSTPNVSSGGGGGGLPQDLDFFEPFPSSGMVSGSGGGLLGLNGGSSVGPNSSSYFVDIADMDSTIGKDLCADSSLDVNLEFESLLSSSQMS